MKPLDRALSDCTPQKLEEARLHIETEMVKRNGSSNPPGDRLDIVTDMLVILVEKYRRLGKLLWAAVALLLIGTTSLGWMTTTMLAMQKRMEQLQADQETLLSQQRETRKTLSETKDKVDKTSQTVVETKEVVEKAVEAAPSASAKPPRLKR